MDSAKEGSKKAVPAAAVAAQDETNDACNNAFICAQNIATDQIENYISRSDKDNIRLCEVFYAVGGALKDDIAYHPWKLFFYTTPFPPLCGTLVLFGTLALFAAGNSERMKHYRKTIRNSIYEPINYENYKPFMHPNAVKLDDKGDGATPEKDVSPLKMQWKLYSTDMWLQTKKYLARQTIHLSNSMPRSKYNAALRHFLKKQIKTTREKQRKNRARNALAALQ